METGIRMQMQNYGFKRKFVFHKVWFDLGRGVDTYVKYAKEHHRLLDLHPGCTVIVWTEEESKNLISEYLPWFLSTYLSMKEKIYQIDSIRYCIMYIFGEIYLDILLDRRLDELIDGPFPLQIERQVILVKSFATMVDFMLSNYFMYSIPRHPLWKMVLKDIKKNTKNPLLGFNPSWISTMCVSGPFMLQCAVNRCIKKGYDIVILPQNSFGESKPTNILNISKSYEKHGWDSNYGLHGYEKSWSPNNGQKHDLIRVSFVAVLMIVLLFFLFSFFKKKKTKTTIMINSIKNIFNIFIIIIIIVVRFIQ